VLFSAIEARQIFEMVDYRRGWASQWGENTRSIAPQLAELIVVPAEHLNRLLHALSKDGLLHIA
jgi:hypothetical protein